MPTLREYQRRFAAELTAGAAPDRATGRAPGLLVYRNAFNTGLANTLRRAYPVVAMLVGERCFRSIGYRYCRAHPPRDGAQWEFGFRLAQFIAGERILGGACPYLGDVAALEWACQRAFLAPDDGPLDLVALSITDTGAYGRLYLRLHPSASLIAADFPVRTIWAAHQREGENFEPIELERRAERTLVWRDSNNEVLVRALGRGEFRLLDALARGAALTRALHAAFDDDPRFDARNTLERLVSSGVVTGFSIGELPAC